MSRGVVGRDEVYPLTVLGVRGQSVSIRYEVELKVEWAVEYATELVEPARERVRLAGVLLAVGLGPRDSC